MYIHVHIYSFFFKLKVCVLLHKHLEGQLVYLCKQSNLPNDGDYTNHNGYDDIEKIVKDVSDDPVGCPLEAILFHHYQVLLLLILNKSSYEYLMMWVWL